MVYCHKCGKELPPESAFCPRCGTPVPGSTRTSYAPATTLGASPVTVNLATVGDRAVAVIIDTIILALAGLLLALPVGLLGLFTLGVFPAIFFGPFTLLWWLIWLVYFTLFEGTSGQTLGKQAVGIRVVDESSQRPPHLEQAVLRNILRIIDWLPFLYIIGFILVETQPTKKRLGDIVGRTVVVKA